MAGVRMQSSFPRGNRFVWIAAVAASLLAAVAIVNAVRWYGRPVAGVLVTSDLEVSSLGRPDWDGAMKGLAYPDRIVAVDGVDLSRLHATTGARERDRRVVAAFARGQPSVRVAVITASGHRDIDLRIDRLGPAVWWLYGGMLIFTASLYVIAALTALAASPGGQLARAFAKYSLLAGVYLFCFFDSATSLVLSPLWDFAYGWTPLALIALALRLPDDVPVARRAPGIFLALDVIGVAAGLLMGGRALLGESTSELRAAWTMVFGTAGLLFLVVFVCRFVLATGPRRDLLRVLLRAMAVPYGLVACGVLVSTLSPKSSAAAFLALPALALAPIATGVSSAKNNLWGSRAILSRVATLVISGSLAVAAAVLIGGAVAASLGVPFGDALVAAAAGAMVAGPLAYVAIGTVERSFFPAVAGYKPTIEQLSDDLSSASSPSEVGAALERTVRRWLACERVELVMCDVGEAEVASGPVLAQGEVLSLAVKFGGRVLGFLRVVGHRGGALFTTEDVDLLGTIANHAAIALAYAQSYAELEQRRRQQAAAWQVERLALVEALAAEVAHEVRYPINFFRSIFQRAPEEATLSVDEIEVGCEEVDRLERLVSGLRRLVAYRVERRAVSLADLASHAEILLRDALGDRRLEVDVPSGVALRCDPDQVRQVLVNLVSNALEASGPAGRVGIAWEPGDAGADLVVWDTGPGFEGDPSSLFVPWFTTKPHGTGLGLAITQRIVRAHNWRIDAFRRDGRTRFGIAIPCADFVDGSTLPHGTISEEALP
ncbi:MAG: ATP-binding protein [Polyangiaceae bacterium]